MSQNAPPTYVLLHLRFRLRVSPDAFLSQSRIAATHIALVKGLIWKIWLVQNEEREIGGMYLFANREAAVDYLDHPIVQAVCNNPGVIATDSQIWNIEDSLSAITRAPLAEPSPANAQPEPAFTGGR